MYVVVAEGVNATPFDTLLFQEYEVAPEPESVTGVPVQTVWSAPALTVGNELTVTTVAALAADVQPFPSVTCTVGEDVVETVIEAVVAPVLQRYDEPELAVKTTLPPEQKVIGPPAVIVAVLLQILALKIGCIRL